MIYIIIGAAFVLFLIIILIKASKSPPKPTENGTAPKKS